jgi:hypothetical protein
MLSDQNRMQSKMAERTTGFSVSGKNDVADNGAAVSCAPLAAPVVAHAVFLDRAARGLSVSRLRPAKY